LSNLAIFAGSIANLIFNMPRQNPVHPGPLIDYDLLLLVGIRIVFWLLLPLSRLRGSSREQFLDSGQEAMTWVAGQSQKRKPGSISVTCHPPMAKPPAALAALCGHRCHNTQAVFAHNASCADVKRAHPHETC
jgi:hypothetical protein